MSAEYELVHVARGVEDVFLDVEPKAANALFTPDEIREVCAGAIRHANSAATDSGKKYEFAYQVSKALSEAKKKRLESA